ncbi:TlpA family protein disulfide reductase [Agathobaculum sp. Marseille-P7918]|uniref:TlpA family protein disulfide reductase n=1 Tax=Agathobaculum sp. Marseille-P7918 TaxID=2479843 RepID=UPI00356B41F8
MKRIPFALLGISLAGMLALSACSSTNQTAGTNTTGQGITDAQSGSGQTTEQAGVLSSFSATDLDGNTVDQSVLADYDLTMVNVWATFCGPCINEMPDLGELAQEYADKKVQIIGLVSDVLNTDGTISEEQVQTARDIVEQTGASYLHLLPSEDLYGVLGQISAVPTTFFVDSEGKQVGSAIVSAQSKDKWVQTIDAMLTEVQG